MPAGLKIADKPLPISLREVPEIGKQELKDGDLYVQEIDGGNFGYGPRISWYAIVHRPTSGEIFKIGCWDGVEGGYSPDIPSENLPDGVTVVE